MKKKSNKRRQYHEECAPTSDFKLQMLLKQKSTDMRGVGQDWDIHAQNRKERSKDILCSQQACDTSKDPRDMSSPSSL